MQVIIFPGQGSQFRGMGKKLFDKFPNETVRASEILGYDIERLCTEDPENKLSFTEYTQPALFVVNALSWMDRKKSLKAVDFLMGHSLGEYNALYAADAFSFETGLVLVKERGRLMSQAKNGGMLVTLGPTVEELKTFLKSNKISNVEIANYNTANQLVLSGGKKEIEACFNLFEKEGIRALILNVSGAFHSSYMKSAEQDFSLFLKTFSFNPPSVPVIANATGEPYAVDEISKLLGMQISQPVLWEQSVRYLIHRDRHFQFEELGENRILTKMVNTIKEESVPIAADSKQPVEHKKEISPQLTLSAQQLGAVSFRHRYGLDYAYVTGAMYKGIASKEMVVAIGNAGFLGFLGTGGMSLSEIEQQTRFIQQHLGSDRCYGLNLLCQLDDPEAEIAAVQLYLKLGVTCIEASAYTSITPALVLYRLSGLKENNNDIELRHRIIAKVSRPEVAEAFLSPAPDHIVAKFLAAGKITPQQAEMAKKIPMCDDICVEADSGGHTDQGIATVILPAIQILKARMEKHYVYQHKVHIGLAGGIGTPEAAAAAFIMGADFIMTGSINQCTVESGASEAAKNLLQEINVQDTDYAPAGDMFEFGAKVQVLKKGVFFPARANKLFMLYSQYNSWAEIPEKTRLQLESKYFYKTYAELWNETKKYHLGKGRKDNIARAERDSKHELALVFRSYFAYSTKIAILGDQSKQIDFQIHTGPALGAFNQWVKGTELENWRNRYVDKIGKMLMSETADFLARKFNTYLTL